MKKNHVCWFQTYSFKSKIDATHAALCDSINTPVAMDEIMALISETNKYMAGGAGYVNIELLEDIAGWVAKMLQVCWKQRVFRKEN